MYCAQRYAGITTLTNGGDTLSPESVLGKDSRVRRLPAPGVCEFRVDNATPSTRRPQRQSSITRCQPKASAQIARFHPSTLPIKQHADGPTMEPNGKQKDRQLRRSATHTLSHQQIRSCRNLLPSAPACYVFHRHCTLTAAANSSGTATSKMRHPRACSACGRVTRHTSSTWGATDTSNVSKGSSNPPPQALSSDSFRVQQ